MDIRDINLTPAELKAIEEHKYFLSQKRGAEVSIEEAIRDFLEHFAEDWRREKIRRDNLDQRQEIERHKYLRSEKEGRDIGRAVAAEEWCQKYAHIWRVERESLERNGFVRITVVARNPHELHLRPMSAVGKLATQYDCDVYVHREGGGMPLYNFLLQGKPFMNVKSIIGFLSLGVALGDTLEFIATGAQATHALEAIARLMSSETVPGPAAPAATAGP
jgi:phosphotransferase system HPr (HPr) family protein